MGRVPGTPTTLSCAPVPYRRVVVGVHVALVLQGAKVYIAHVPGRRARRLLQNPQDGQETSASRVTRLLACCAAQKALLCKYLTSLSWKPRGCCIARRATVRRADTATSLFLDAGSQFSRVVVLKPVLTSIVLT